jgi:hypothetical protein
MFPSSGGEGQQKQSQLVVHRPQQQKQKLSPLGDKKSPTHKPPSQAQHGGSISSGSVPSITVSSEPEATFVQKKKNKKRKNKKNKHKNDKVSVSDGNPTSSGGLVDGACHNGGEEPKRKKKRY